MNFGLPELAVIMIIVLLFFGPSRLPGLGKSIGSAIRGFKKGISHDEEGREQVKEKITSSQEEHHNS